MTQQQNLRILVVGSDAAGIATARRELADIAPEWTLTWADTTDADSAAQLAADADVVVCASRNEGFAPLAFLAQLRTRQPDAVRILLVDAEGEHDALAALEVSQRGYVLESGELTLEGPCHDLLHDPKVRAAYLGE